MKKLIITSLFMSLASNVLALGGISGDLSVYISKDLSKVPAVNYTVYILDAVTAELYPGGKVSTDTNGHFEASGLPAGAYKIRVDGRTEQIAVEKYICSDQQKTIDETVKEDPFLFSDNDIDVFDSAKVYYINDNRTAYLSHDFHGKVITPTPIIDQVVYLHLYVSTYDQTPDNTISGLSVSLLDPVNAMQFTEKCYGKGDDYKGVYYEEDYYTCYSTKAAAKVVVKDPSGVYLSEFYGAGSYNFTLGKVVNISPDQKNYIEFGLSKFTAISLIGAIVTSVDSLTLPEEVKSLVVGSLGRATDFFEDENPNNDRASCGVLNGLTGKLKGMENSGEITENDSYWLTSDINNAATLLGCN